MLPHSAEGEGFTAALLRQMLAPLALGPSPDPLGPAGGAGGAPPEDFLQKSKRGLPLVLTTSAVTGL